MRFRTLALAAATAFSLLLAPAAHADNKAIATDEMEAYLERGWHIGITGWLCDERRGAHLRQMVGRIPADRLMIETDAPYLLPRTVRPQPSHRRNEPMYLRHIAKVIATARGETLEDLAAHTTQTARDFFDFPAQ